MPTGRGVNLETAPCRQVPPTPILHSARHFVGVATLLEVVVVAAGVAETTIAAEAGRTTTIGQLEATVILEAAHKKVGTMEGPGHEMTAIGMYGIWDTTASPAEILT